MAEFERRVDVSGGYCLPHSDAHKNYGVAACRVYFILIGPLGAVQFVIRTDWYPEAARRHLARFSHRDERQPQGWDVGYHAKTPQYDGQTDMECDLLGGRCFYDGSSLQAEEWVEGFINGGTDWLWPRLEQLYRCRFEGGEYPDITPLPRRHPDETSAA